MGTWEKQKFDLITASKTKKYKIITAVVLVLGVLMLVGGILLHGSLTSAVTPNDLRVVPQTLSGYDGETCTLSQDETFVLSTGTLQNRPLTEAIKFKLDEDAQKFLVIQNHKNQTITSSNYQGLFRFHITNPDVDNQSGKVRITCANKIIEITVVYTKQK